MTQENGKRVNVKLWEPTHYVVKVSAAQKRQTIQQRADELIRAGLAAEQKTTTREPVHEPA